MPIVEVLSVATVRIGERARHLADHFGHPVAALLDLLPGLRVRQVAQDRVRHGVRADVMATPVQRGNHVRGHHEIQLAAATVPAGDFPRHLHAPFVRLVFELVEQRAERAEPGVSAVQLVAAQLELAQVQRAAVVPHRLDDQVVPHAAVGHGAGGDEEAGAHPAPLQRGRCELEVVAVAVVERDAGGARRQRATLQANGRFGQRQHVEVAADPVEHLLETLEARLGAEQRIGLAEHAVVAEDQQPATSCRAAERVQRDAPERTGCRFRQPCPQAHAASPTTRR